MKKEKVCNVLLFILIFVSILSIIILRPISDLDEIWNYNFARNISDGLVPYRDFNMVITPLLSFACGIILKMTFNELIVMRVLAAFMCAFIIYITYKIFNILNIKKEVVIIFTFFIGYLFRNIFCIDYNFASLLLVLIIIYLEIKYYKENIEFIRVDIKRDILLGILAGLAFSTKQTSGLLICMVVLGNKLLFIRNKEEFIISIKSFLYRSIGVLIPILLLIWYLIINNAFVDFISYTIKGVSEFKNVISYKTLINLDLLGVLSILVPVTFIYAWIKSVIFEKDKMLYILTIYGLAIFVICFPISDEIHFLVAALPFIISILYEIYNLTKKNKIFKEEEINKFIFLTLKYIIIMFLIYNCIINFNKYFKSKENFTSLNHFKYIPIDKSFEQDIINIDEYIKKNNDVKILDFSAAIYMISIDRYNKDYDMFNKGNFGHKGEERIIQDISKSNDIKYLILKEEFSKNWQAPLDILEYVMNNKTKTEEIGIFDIYE